MSAPCSTGTEEALGGGDLRRAMALALGGVSVRFTYGAAFEEVFAHVARAASPDERRALVVSHDLGGAKALLGLLGELFPHATWFPCRYVRLCPPRRTYVMMAYGAKFVGDRWYEVSCGLALACLTVASPTAVFDVRVARPSGRVVVLNK